jgi:hypothetical protein
VSERFAQPRIWGALERLYREVSGTTRAKQASKED